MSQSFEEEDFDISQLDDVEEIDYENIEPINIKDYYVENNCCVHKDTINDGNIEKCKDCGLELSSELSMEPEWRFYDGDGKNIKDPSRCRPSKDDTKNIFKDLEQYNLSSEMCKIINDLYIKVTNGKILRANNRKSTIYACVIEAYKQLPDPVIPEDLEAKFKLSRKEISKGLKEFKLSINKISANRRTIHISPLIYIDRLMSNFKGDDKQVKHVKDLYTKIYGKNTQLNRSHQKSVMAGLVYYYFKLLSVNNDKYDMPIEKYSQIVKLSGITIIKIAKIITKLLGTHNEIII